MNTLIDTLQNRGFIDAITHEEIRAHLKTPQKVYCGFDPTSDSLHLGNLVGIIGLSWFQRFGHTPVALVGGATGMIGDPGGRSSERNLLTKEDVERNLRGITGVIERLFDFEGDNRPQIVNNYDWFENFTVIEFLRDVGKSFRLSTMLAKDAVKSRLASEEGISFTEFSYQILQAYDFYHLAKNSNVTIQIGGSDQWGNITQGTDLVRKELGKPVFGLTFPLLTRADGKKFGKSEQGAIWLSTDKLSEYEFYQYLYRVADADVIKLLKMLTFLPLAEIEEIAKSMQQEGYQVNSAQKVLAAEVTRFVHGEEGLQKALQATEIAFNKDKRTGIEDLELIAKDIPHFEAKEEEVVGTSLIDLLVRAGMQPSKGAGRKLIQGGGVYMNDARIDEVDKKVHADDVMGGKFILLRIGKKQKLLVKIT